MTDQEIFDRVATHLFEQGKQALNYQSCAYRSEDGCECAVGVLILDEHYSPDLEGGAVRREDVSTAVERSIKRFPENLLTNLQDAHDCQGNWISTTEMGDRLRYIAEEFNLDDAIVDTLRFKDR